MSQTQNLSKANRRKVYLKASDFLLDMAKLVFAGIILTGLVNLDVDKFYLFLFGISLTVTLSLWGYIYCLFVALRPIESYGAGSIIFSNDSGFNNWYNLERHSYAKRRQRGCSSCSWHKINQTNNLYLLTY